MSEQDSRQESRQPLLNVSAAQVVGGSAAAATAAVLGSHLGVAGTISGAALVSVVTAVSGSLYTQSLRRTQEVIRATSLLPRNGDRTRTQPVLRDEPAPTTEELRSVVEETTPSVWSRVGWKSVAAVAAVVFVVTGVVITGTELLTGKSLDGSSRTTAGKVVGDGGTPSSDQTPSEEPSTDTTPSSTPSSRPTASPTTAPSAKPTASPSASPSASASAEPSASASPTDDPTDPVG